MRETVKIPPLPKPSVKYASAAHDYEISPQT